MSAAEHQTLVDRVSEHTGGYRPTGWNDRFLSPMRETAGAFRPDVGRRAVAAPGAPPPLSGLGQMGTQYGLRWAVTRRARETRPVRLSRTHDREYG